MRDRTKRINDLLTQANELRDNRDLLDREIIKCENARRAALQDYRIESVARIVDFILDEYRSGKIVDLDRLLTHCLNKLHGNIDGVELDLSDYSKNAKHAVTLPLNTSDAHD